MIVPYTIDISDDRLAAIKAKMEEYESEMAFHE